MIRRIAERLARGTVIRRRFPKDFGRRRIYVSPDSALSFLKPRWTASFQPLLDLAASHAAGADAVWDIGSNCGVFAVAAAHVAAIDAEIVAVEPDPFLASLLTKTVQLPENRCRTIRVLCAAISNRSGIGRFFQSARGRSQNSLEEAGPRSRAQGTRWAQDVPLISLDELLKQYRPPRLVKIDVEGAELLVLEGADRLLHEVRPHIYIEVGGEMNAAVTSLLRRHSYRLFDGDALAEGPRETCSFNTLAIPMELDVDLSPSSTPTAASATGARGDRAVKDFDAESSP
jgi:FkbM family methyltransferase